MGISIEMTKAFMDSKSMRYQESNDGKVLKVGIGGLKNKGSVDILVFFDDDDTSVGIRCFNICSVPENKKQDIYKVCSQQNHRFRWVKFYVGSEDNSVSAEDDAVIQPESCGEEIFELILRMAGVVDEAYPIFMKALWS